jgi:hypothetical protein
LFAESSSFGVSSRLECVGIHAQGRSDECYRCGGQFPAVLVLALTEPRCSGAKRRITRSTTKPSQPSPPVTVAYASTTPESKKLVAKQHKPCLSPRPQHSRNDWAPRAVLRRHKGLRHCWRDGRPRHVRDHPQAITISCLTVPVVGRPILVPSFCFNRQGAILLSLPQFRLPILRIVCLPKACHSLARGCSL